MSNTQDLRISRSWSRQAARADRRGSRSRRTAQDAARVAASMEWLTRGYERTPTVIGDALFEESHENMVMVRDIELYSLCEHHMLPFYGKAHIAYIPNGRIVGLSKLPRVVDVFAQRLQVQERLTEQIARGAERRARAAGRGRRDRGVPPLHDDARRREAELETITSSLRGVFRDDPQDARRVPAARAQRP